jgi:hypothetical protein
LILPLRPGLLAHGLNGIENAISHIIEVSYELGHLRENGSDALAISTLAYKESQVHRVTSCLNCLNCSLPRLMSLDLTPSSRVAGAISHIIEVSYELGHLRENGSDALAISTLAYKGMIYTELPELPELLAPAPHEP